MRGIILTMMAFLAMTSLGLAAVSVDFVPDQYYDVGTNPVDTGYKSFLVQATGENLNELTEFTITGSRTGGDIYQVFNAGAATPWIGDGGTTTGDPMDSYIMIGSYRLPDAANPYVTAETLDTIVAPNEGMGTLTNYYVDPVEGVKFDGYLRLAGDDYTPGTTETVDLFHIVLPDGAYATVDVTLYTADLNPATGFYDVINEHNLSTQVNCPLDGDADENGKIGTGDLSLVGYYWGQPGGWGEGDMDGDGTIGTGDLSLVGYYWGSEADWYVAEEAAGGSPVPEPGTLALLILGSLCFAGYRLRK